MDFSYIYELSGGDKEYVCDIISLFLASVPDKLLELEQLIADKMDLKAIADYAHMLKSSASVVKIRDMHPDLVQIEILAKSRSGFEEIQKVFQNIIMNYNEALPVLYSELERNKAAEE